MSSNSRHAIRLQLDMEPNVGRYPLLGNSNNENQALPLLPLALNNMLKTTTESGDVGQFAIKPARVPQASRPTKSTGAAYNGPTLQRPQRSFNFGARTFVFDDRKRLPSYSRDTTSEIISMYETASQKSPGRSQFQVGVENRSYSMTQTSYLPHTLSNHRSYASLRSQPDFNLIQRPRSPFPYPTRLKRLGFQPTSPILASGRTADFSLRADIQRTPDGYSGTRSAPPSFYATKRAPAGLRRSNATKSNPSLLGHSPTSQRSSFSPRRSSIGSIQDWRNDTEKTTRKVSPTQNMLSTDFATNILQHHALPSTRTPIGKRAQLPLFYDYTEEFNTEEALQVPGFARERVSPSPFSVEKTIHEDRKLSSESFTGEPTIKAETSDVSISSHERAQSLAGNSRIESVEHYMERITNVTQDIIPLYLDRHSHDSVLPTATKNIVLTNSNSQTGMDNETSSSELCHSNILPTPISSINQKLNTALEDFQHVEICVPNDHSDLNDLREGDSLFDGRSSIRLSSLLPNFPNSLNRSVYINGGVITTVHGQQISSDHANLYGRDLGRQAHADNEASAPGHLPLSPTEHASSGFGQTQQHLARDVGISLPLPKRNHIRSSRFYSIDHGLIDLAELITKLKLENGSSQSRAILSYSPTPQVLPTLPHIGRRQLSLFMDSRMALKRFRSEGDLRDSKLKAERHRPHNHPGEQVTNNKGNGETEKLLRSATDARQFVDESFLRPNLPMLAPQPISPARALKVKNSIPQLMKALPPIPLDVPYKFLHQEQSLYYDVPSGASPVLSEIDLKTTKKSRPQNVELVPRFVTLAPQDQASNQVVQSRPIPLPQHRFKLKSKFFQINRSPSPPSSRPWNLEENYPWVGQQTDIRLPPVNPKPIVLHQSSKFKWQSAKTSDDLSGTVKINSDAKRFRAISSLDLRHPRDLFTSTSNLNDVFRQVSRQFSSGSTSASMEVAPAEQYMASPVPTHPISPTEVRSFFSDNSSQIRNHNGLRKRISNLRARLPHPYLLRSVAQTNGTENAIQLSGGPTRTRVISAFHDGSRHDVDEYGLPRTEARHLGLKSKVSSWFKETRMAIGWRGKTLDDDEVRCFAIHR